MTQPENKCCEDATRLLTVRTSTHEAGRAHIYHLLIGVCQYVYTLANHYHSSEQGKLIAVIMFLSFLECLGQGARHTYTGIHLGQGSGPNFFPCGSADGLVGRRSHGQLAELEQSTDEILIQHSCMCCQPLSIRLHLLAGYDLDGSELYSNVDLGCQESHDQRQQTVVTRWLPLRGCQT